MFSWQDPDADGPPPPVLFDYDLPDSLRQARHAALLPLKPALAARGWTEPKFLLLKALAEAGEPLPQGEAGARAGLYYTALRPHIARLIEDGYIAWAPPKKRQFPYIAARDIGRRQVNHIERELRRGGARSWADLAALPDEVRVSERMCAHLFALMDKATHVCAGETTDTRANEPAGLPDPQDLVAVTLPLAARRTRAALVARIARVLRHYDLSEAQWRILRILGSDPGRGWTRRGLERRGCFHFSDPAVQRALHYLNDRELVSRQWPGTRPSEWHRRNGRKRWRVEIVRAGIDMIRRIEGKERAACADLFERIGAREAWQLDRLLQRATCALLWRDGVAPEDQATHPFAAHYARFDAYVFGAARAFEFHARILREAGLPVPTKKIFHWWE